MQTEIRYSTDTKRYDLLVDGLYHSQHTCQVDAENAADELRLTALKAMSPAMRLSLLATEYGKAKAEGRTADAARIKRRAMEIKAQQRGVSFEVFEREYQEYRETKAAA